MPKLSAPFQDGEVFTLSDVCKCAEEVLSLNQLFNWVINQGKTGVAVLRKDTHLKKIENVEKACKVDLDLVKKQIETAYDYFSPLYFVHARTAFEKALMKCATV